MEFASAAEAVLPLATCVELELTRPYGAAVLTPARVEGRREESTRRIYRLRCETSLQDFAGQQVNRRAAFRVPVSTARPMPIEVLDPKAGRSSIASVYDLSATGVGFRGDASLEAELWQAVRLRVVFDLNDGSAPVVVYGHIANRQIFDSLVHYGVAFDQGTLSFALTRERLVRWSLAQQRELLRSLASRRLASDPLAA